MHLESIADALHHFLLVERLGEEVARAQVEGLHAGVAVGLRGQHDDWRRLFRPAGFQPAEHLMAAQVRHVDVQQDQVRQLLLEHGLDPARVVDPVAVPVAVLLEQGQQQLDVDLTVVDHQDFGVRVKRRG
ncbi:hypothetical protein D3C75_1071320 [compost metagenome]